MKLPDDISTNDHTHTADCDAHGCAYKEPAAEQETQATQPRTVPINGAVPAPVAGLAEPAPTPKTDELLFFHPVLDVDGAVESNIPLLIDFARSLEREAAALRRQLDEAKEDAREARGDASRAAMDAVRYAKELAAEREGRKAAFRQGVQLGKVEAERERDAALAQAAAVQEEIARFLEDHVSWSLVQKVRSLTIAPNAGRRLAEDAARFVYYCKVLYDYSLQADWPDSFRDAETIDQLRAAIDAARKGEEG